MEEVLHQVEQFEKKYEWLRVAESYEKALKLFPTDDFSREAETYERLGYAFYRAAFQAEGNEEFRQRLNEARASYEKARELNQRADETTKTARTFRCDAMIAYVGYWLASEAIEKKRLIDECWALAKASLKVLSESGLVKEYGKTYNELSCGALLRYCLEWNYEARKGIMKEAIEHGEAAIQFLSRTDDTDELARACAKTSFCLSLWAYFFVDLDEKDSFVRKAQGYWGKAKATCEDSAGPEMLCPVSCAHDLLWGQGTEEALTSIKRALENCRKAKDRFLIGSALDWLTYHTGWARAAGQTSTDDPDEFAEIRRRVIHYAEEAKQHYSAISFISPRADAFWIEGIYAEPDLLGHRFEIDPQKKRDLFEKALDVVKDELKQVKASGYPEAMVGFHWSFYRLSLGLSRIEANSHEKKKLMEEGFQHAKEFSSIVEQLEPLAYWDRGVYNGSVAWIKCDLALLSEDSETKRKMLEEAVTELEKALKLLARYMEFQPEKRLAQFGAFGWWQYELGYWLSHLYRLTYNKEHLEKAVKVFNETVESYQRTRIISRIAECYWKCAQAYDGLSEHLKSAESFSLASSSFMSAVEKVPQLKRLYEQHAVYMQAWSEIEKARHHHERQEYGLAEEHFQNAASMHKSLRQWSYLAPNYSAWAQVDHAEELSRKEQDEEAIASFEKAAKLFDETKTSIQSQFEKIEDADEKRVATDMLKATEARHEYCEARIAVEEAKLLDRRGDHYSSSKKYGSAAETFERITQRQETEQEKREIQFITALSRAWQKMTLAEAEASPTLYAEASEVFEEARAYAPNEKTKMLVLGHSRFCEALEAGARFVDTRDQSLHAVAVQHLASASNYYIKADFQTASEYAKATKLLFDAYVYMDDAEKEGDPEKKAKLYVMVERVLQTSAGCYTKAEHPEKREQMLKLLEKAKEEQELAASMVEALHAPSIVSATTAFASPTPTQEQAVGSERFEHADVQANLMIGRKELRIGESLSLEMELVNAGKGPALLIKVNGAVPQGFELIEKPETYRVEDSYINLKGKRLDPLKAEELRLVLKPTARGTFYFKPTILYLDENGKYKSHELEPVCVTVKELGVKDWLKGER